MKTLNRLTVVIVLVSAIIGVLLWQRQHAATVAKKASPLTTVTLALDWTPNTDHTGVYAALAKGWYKSQGINLQILPYSSSVSSNTLVTNGKADIGIGTVEDIIGSQAKDHSVVGIGSVLQHNTSGFIVREESGINSPKDLDGKIYGGFGSPLENTIVSAVIKKDGGKGDFKNVVLDVDAMQALESGKIDFVWVLAGWEVIQAKRDGVKAKFFPITSYGVPDSPTLAFIVTPDKVKLQADTLKRFMAATSQGYEYARKNPKESAQALIDTAPKGTFPDTGLVFDSQAYLSTQYADAGGRWGTADPRAWQNYAQFVLDSGTVTDASNKPVKALKFDALYTNQFIPATGVK